ncbi:MAG: hypothetical protein CFE23_07310 [Flavobacterium sp. BFFFF1]|uniref:DUF5675 family protein n=1 Tax=unclassified Flavobacterium TaxID=196869 RepID=UPI000BDD781E|nr:MULTISPECIES: DUF5675 family protein [unclassified Flavobacterium]OYU80773.1 MAG: hypothetical protein CFE23_07310 [Flavobacterium sp. BFFFF1]
MELVLTRKIRSAKSTIGELTIDGKFECFTLEDVERDVKIHGKTAIPKGRYELTITMSNRFKKELPLLINVPNYEGVRIHPGNKAEDTEGCILVGKTKTTDFIGNSRDAFEALFPKLKNYPGKKYITIQ